MPNRDKRGGHHPPKNPAAVSLPGKDSSRTDKADGTKNPSNATQAAQRIPGQTYGVGKQLMEQQQSAPLAAAPGSGIPSPAQGNGGNTTNNSTGQANLPFDPFAPSPNNATGPVVDDEDIYIDNPDMFIAELARLVPHPDLLNLLDMRDLRGVE